MTVGPIPVKLTNFMDWTATLVLEKLADHRGISLSFGARRYRPEQHHVTALIKDAPQQFASLLPPETLPPLSSYRKKTDSWERHATFESIGRCEPEL